MTTTPTTAPTTTTAATTTPKGIEDTEDMTAPVIKRSAVPSGKDAAKVQADKLAAIASSGRFRSTGRSATGSDWYSGWCSPTKCRDGMADLTDTPRYRCLGVGENGVKVTPRYLFCACTCHRTNPQAVPVPDDLEEFNDAATQAASVAAAEDA